MPRASHQTPLRNLQHRGVLQRRKSCDYIESVSKLETNKCNYWYWDSPDLVALLRSRLRWRALMNSFQWISLLLMNSNSTMLYADSERVEQEWAQIQCCFLISLVEVFFLFMLIHIHMNYLMIYGCTFDFDRVTVI